MSSRSSNRSSSNSFGETSKYEIKSSSGQRCWICQSRPTQACHVITKGDEIVFELFKSRNLLPDLFNLSSVSNGISLCPTCHVNFDAYHDPGFVILPSNLQYFIDFEVANYSQREASALRGVAEPRTTPSAADYLAYQIQQREIDTRAKSGSYLAIVFHDYSPFLPLGKLTAKEWPGHPLTMIRRGLIALGTARVENWPQDLRSELLKLQELYARPAPQLDPAAMGEVEEVEEAEAQSA